MSAKKQEVYQPKFTVSQLIETRKYTKYADIINAIYEPETLVSKEELDSAIKKYLGRSV